METLRWSFLVTVFPLIFFLIHPKVRWCPNSKQWEEQENADWDVTCQTKGEESKHGQRKSKVDRERKREKWDIKQLTNNKQLTITRRRWGTKINPDKNK